MNETATITRPKRGGFCDQSEVGNNQPRRRQSRHLCLLLGRQQEQNVRDDYQQPSLRLRLLHRHHRLRRRKPRHRLEPNRQQPIPDLEPLTGWRLEHLQPNRHHSRFPNPHPRPNPRVHILHRHVGRPTGQWHPHLRCQRQHAHPPLQSPVSSLKPVLGFRQPANWCRHKRHPRLA